MGVWGSFLIAAAALKTPTRSGSNAQGGNLTFCVSGAERVRVSPRPYRMLIHQIIGLQKGALQLLNSRYC